MKNHVGMTNSIRLLAISNSSWIKCL